MFGRTERNGAERVGNGTERVGNGTEREMRQWWGLEEENPVHSHVGKR